VISLSSIYLGVSPSVYAGYVGVIKSLSTVDPQNLRFSLAIPPLTHSKFFTSPACSVYQIDTASRVAPHYTANRAGHITFHSFPWFGFTILPCCKPRRSHSGATGIRIPRQHRNGASGASRAV
jgi:hypothetical protein